MRFSLRTLPLFALIVLAGIAATNSTPAQKTAATPEWAMNATIIEACSCPMFCQCYFSDEPAAHHDHASGQMEHYCKGNLAYKVNRGNYGSTKLDGAKFWLAGDLGEKLSDGLDWGIITFDPSVTPPQREAIGKILNYVYGPPKNPEDMKAAQDAPIEWSYTTQRAMAKLDGGKAGEVVLKHGPGNTADPVVIRNLKYIGAPRNDGFILMPNEIQAYHLTDRAFETRNTNGFVITIDINSNDVKSQTASQ